MVKQISRKNAIDPIQVLLVCAIVAFLPTASYFLLHPASVYAMLIGGAILFFHLISARTQAFSKLKHGSKGPSIFMIILLIAPFLIGTLVGYIGYNSGETIVRIILWWALTVTFWSTMLFVPMAAYSKYRENLLPDITRFPRLSILVPCYNEEKVIGNTIQGLLESDYPDKEIIVIDDGSKDNTLKIAQKFSSKIKVLTKSNGGKATALNYGLNFARGEIIAVVDADTIVSKNAFKELVKGFRNDHVAAVAGNIKVRNPINWITKCQFLEYVTGIQIIRRAFDIFGAITIVPGALGAFRKDVLEKAGSYHKDTMVEDFDVTVKVLKSGVVVEGSVKAVSYTEAPSTISDFAKQRKRWYRGNIQVLSRHSDAITNPRFGFLQRLAFPYLLIGMFMTPIVGFIAAGNAIFALIFDETLLIAQISLMFLVVHFLMTALALRIDGESMKFLPYSIFLAYGFKQIVDFLLLKAIVEHLLKKKATWTSAKRTGIANES